MRNGKCRLDVFWWSGTFPSQRAVVYLQTANKMDWWSGECTTATARCVLTYRSTPRRRPSTPFYLRTCGSWYIDARIYQYMFPLIVTRKKRANKQSHFEKTKQKNCGIRRRFRFPPSVSTQYRLLKYKRTVKFRCWQKYFIIVWQNNISKHQRQSISSTDFVSMLHWENKGHDPPILSFWVVAQSVGGCREPQQKHQPSTMI